MSSNRLDAVVRCIHRIAAGHAEHLSDRTLLDRYVKDRNDDAFAVLVHRHAGLVLGVCQRIVQDRHAAEDCFQAVFLVLATKARTLKRHNVLGPWLHVVAHKVALKSNALARSRNLREQHASRSLLDWQADSLEWRELAPVLDDAVARLPDKYRVPFVLCYLQGKSIREIALLMNLPRGTVASRLARARAKLRARLLRNGVSLSVASLALGLSESQASALVTPSLIQGTIQASKLLATGVGTAAVLSQSTMTLMRGTIPMSIFANLKSLTGILAALAVGVLLLGYCSMTLFGAAPGAKSQKQPPQNDASPKNAPVPKLAEQAGDVSNKLKTVSFLSLQRPPMEVYRLAPGDTIGLVIDGILGDTQQIVPVQQRENPDVPLAIGYPVVVREDSTISLPQIPPFKVTGFSIAELESALRREYTSERKIVSPQRFSCMVTLMRKRNVRVVVIREDVSPDSSSLNKAGASPSNSGPKRSSAQVLDLPYGNNDLLTALVRTGGIPGASAADEVIIERIRPASHAAKNAETQVSIKNGSGDASAKYITQTLHIPLKLRANARVSFTEDDISFENGDIVYVRARDDS